MNPDGPAVGPVVLGTRGSRLALVQANACAGVLRAAGLEVEVRIIKTTSEHHPDLPFSVIDRRDVFTRQLDEALLAGDIDLAVHSLKDVPTELPDGIVLAAVTERHDPRDVLISDAGCDVDGLPREAVVATSSLRRRAQLLHRRPDLRIVEIRGNVDTRIRKMREGVSDALVLARAGLERLGLDVPHAVVPPDVLLPAVGQGALTAATVADHPLRDRFREVLNHDSSERAVLAERAMLRTLEGGCRVPVGAWGEVLELGSRDGEGAKNGSHYSPRPTCEVRLRGLVVSPDGAIVYEGEATGGEPEEVGERLARDLLGRGAAVILDEVKEVRR